MRVNSVAPGIIFSQTASDNYDMDVFGAAKPEIPAQRLGTPEEVRAVLLGTPVKVRKKKHFFIFDQ